MSSLIQISDYTSGDLNYQFCPFEKTRFRLTGFADFVGFDQSHSNSEFMKNVLLDQTKYLFPDLKWESESDLWIGFRPMSPDNLPYVGQDKILKNLYISCGHGSNGWTTSRTQGHSSIRHVILTRLD